MSRGCRNAPWSPHPPGSGVINGKEEARGHSDAGFLAARRPACGSVDDGKSNPDRSPAVRLLAAFRTT